MKVLFEKKKKSNRLMQGMISISLALHLLLFIYISGMYQSEKMSYIELTMQDISKPFQRSIPRPRVRQKAPEIQNIQKINIQKRYVPRIKIDPVTDNFAENFMEGISTPDIPDSSKFDISGLDIGGNEKFFTTNDYFDMLRTKIESCKKYPDEAKSRYIEGRVTIRFVLTKDGQVSSVKIIKHARHGSLDKAALKAVKDAAPFPIPPGDLFKGPIHMEITIVFELI